MRMMIVKKKKKKKKKGMKIKIQTKAAVSEEDCPLDDSRASAKRTTTSSTVCSCYNVNVDAGHCRNHWLVSPALLS